MKQLNFTAIPVGTTIELHATGCRDLRKWAGDRWEIVSDSVKNAESDLRSAETGIVQGETRLKVMPCCNERRMRAAGRVHEVDAQPVAGDREPTLEEALANIEAMVVNG